jgi:NADH-quinone oxidoreductase subunit N
MNLASLADVILVTPLIVLLLGSMAPLALKVGLGNKEPNNFIPLAQGVGAILSALILLVTTYGLAQGRENPFAFNQMIAIDGMSIVSGCIVLVAGLFTLFLIRENPTTQGNQFSELVFLLLNSILGMLVLVQATDLLMVFVGLEVMSLPLYVMIGIGHDRVLSKESAIKYFLLGSFASAILLMGISFIYGTTGSTSLVQLSSLGGGFLLESKMFALGMILLVVGFSFKVSLFPFHAWTADVYQGAPTPLTALMATAVKVASMTAFIRFVVIGYFGQSDALLNSMQWLAALTMLIGNAGALIQNNLKRVLAFSSVAHSGYLILGLLVMGLATESTLDAVTAVLFYLVSYSIMTIGTFAFISYLERVEGEQIKVSDLAGLAKRHPYLAMGMTVLLLSLAGVPPLLGFFGKLYLFTEALNQGFVWLTLWAALSSVIGVYYYLRPIVLMYMHDSPDQVPAIGTQEKRYLTSASIILASILVLVLGLFNFPLLEMIRARL